jgi:hypothetical protein
MAVVCGSPFASTDVNNPDYQKLTAQFIIQYPVNTFPIIITRTVNDGSLTDHSDGTATRGMMRERAVQLAVIDGRAPHETCGTDWRRAKHEMATKPVVAPQLPVSKVLPAEPPS